MSHREPNYDDCFAPPADACEVQCLHCGETYDSYLIRWQEDPEDDLFGGHWCCPTPGCDGVGFCFDIWPTDPQWTDERGNRVYFQDDGEDDEFVDIAGAGGSDGTLDPKIHRLVTDAFDSVVSEVDMRLRGDIYSFFHGASDKSVNDGELDDVIPF